MQNAIDGVSAVNADGLVMIFVEENSPIFEIFSFQEEKLILYSHEQSMKMTRTYGPLTMDALKRTGQAIIQHMTGNGKPGSSYVVEVARG